MVDNQKFGEFIASLRKEKGWTQRELAEKLNVTDKAVSKWERGAGFPDIKTIEPLADILGVSVLEIMHSERIQREEIDKGSASDALVNMLDVAKYQRQIERRNILICIIFAALVILLIFLIDSMELIGFLMVCLPVIFLVSGLILLIVSWQRFENHRPFSTTLVLGILAVLFPVFICVFLYFALWLGGPVPQ